MLRKLTKRQRWSSRSKNRAGKKARLFVPCLVPVQFCPTNIAREMVVFFFFFQSLYLAPIIRQMNKKLCAPRLLGYFFFPSPQGREVQTSSDAHTCLWASRSQALTISKKNTRCNSAPLHFTQRILNQDTQPGVFYGATSLLTVVLEPVSPGTIARSAWKDGASPGASRGRCR